MIDKTVSKKYAVGLFNEALEIDKLEEIYNDLNATLKLFQDNPEFSKVLNCVTISFVDKKSIIQKIFSDLNKIAFNFLNILFENNRGLFFQDIVKEYYKLYLNQQNKAEIKLISAYPLEEEIPQIMKKVLSQKLNKEILLFHEIDPEIIGGLIVYYRDLVIDGSVKNHLAELHGKMLSTRT